MKRNIAIISYQLTLIRACITKTVVVSVGRGVRIVRQMNSLNFFKAVSGIYIFFFFRYFIIELQERIKPPKKVFSAVWPLPGSKAPSGPVLSDGPQFCVLRLLGVNMVNLGRRQHLKGIFFFMIIMLSVVINKNIYHTKADQNI